MAMTLGSGRKAEINMTPMIDILLVLIVMFLIITPIAPRGLEALIPQDSRDRRVHAPDRPVVIEVLSDGSFRVNKAPVEPGDLEPRLRDLVRIGAAEVFFIKGDHGIDYQRVAQAIDAANTVGARRIALMTN
jgi:biopolymer transport protein ExbD